MNKDNIIFKKTNNFETLYIRLIFPFEENKKDISKNYILPSMLRYISNNYPEEHLFKAEKMARNIITLNSYTGGVGTSCFFGFSLIIPDTKYLSYDQIDKSVELLHEMTYNPKVINGAFLDSELKREINNVKISIENRKKNLRGYLSYRLPSIIDKNGVYGRTLANNINQLDNLTAKELYTHYKKHIKTKDPYIFVYGNVDKKPITNILKKYFKNDNKVISLYNYDYYLTPNKIKPKIVTEEKDFKQSAVTLIFKIKNFKKKDCVTLNSLRNLLVFPSTRLLFNKLRTEEGLVYSCNANASIRFGILELNAFVDKDKVAFTKDKMLEVIKNLRDENKINILLKEINEDFRFGMEEDKDDIKVQLDDIMCNYFKIKDMPSKVYKEKLKCKAKDIINLINRLQLDTIYYIKEK